MERLAGSLRKSKLLVIAGVLVSLLAPSPAHGTTARMGYFWQSGTLGYDTSFSYRYDVIARPQGAFSEEGPQSFAYITAQNKHVVWDGVPYGVEAVVAYFAGNDGAKEFWIAWLDDTDRYHDIYVAPDADQPNGFLGPHWDLATLRAGGYMTRGRDALGESHRYLRVRAVTRLASESATDSTWENRVELFDFRAERWEVKGSNRFTLSGTSAEVRASTRAAGSGIWAGILETYGDDEGAGDPRPPLEPFGYRNRSVRIVDGGEVRTPRLRPAVNSWRNDGAYELLFRASDGTEWLGSGPTPGR